MKPSGFLLHLASLVALSVFLIGCSGKGDGMTMQTLEVGTHQITVERAVTPEQQAAGLTGRSTLDFDRGMLFLYSEPLIPSFWMKGMKFPIDIVWLRDGHVVEIEYGVVVDDGARRYSPGEPVDAVLELAAGGAAWNSIEVGTSIDY